MTQQQLTLAEALAWLAANPGSELVDNQGFWWKLDIDSDGDYRFMAKHPSEEDFASTPWVLSSRAPFHHPAPAPVPVTLDTLGRFKRVTVEWPEGSRSHADYPEGVVYERIGSGKGFWGSVAYVEISTALANGWPVVGEE